MGQGDKMGNSAGGLVRQGERGVAYRGNAVLRHGRCCDGRRLPGAEQLNLCPLDMWRGQER
jgi:hypothetical protein